MTLLKRSLVMISIPTSILFLVMLCISSSRLKFYSTNQMEDNLISASDAASEYVMNVMRKPRVLLEALNDVFLQGAFASEEENLNLFENLTESYVDSTGFYGVIDGVYYDGTGWVPDEGWNPLTRPWYTGAVAEPDNFVYSDVYIDDQTKSSIVSISKRVFNTFHEPLGVVSVDCKLDSIKDVFSRIKRNNDEDMFILSEKGAFAVHEKYTADDNIGSVNGGEYRDVAGKFLSGGDEIFSAMTGGVPYLYKSTPIEGTHWYFVYGRPRSAVNTFVNKTMQIIILSFVVLFAFIFFSLVLIMRNIVRPIKLTANALSDISSGDADLTKRINFLPPSVEMRTVVESFNDFADKLQDMVSSIKSSSSALDVVSKNMKESVSSVSDSMTKIRLSIGAVQEHVQDQSNGFEETAGTIKVVAESISSVNDMIDDQTSSIRGSTVAVGHLVRRIEDISASMESMASSFFVLGQEAQNGIAKQNNVNERISIIEQQSQMLQEANMAISSIAEQTNLLAMNAAIEAAHAGEAGKGFAVVADEIRKLSETSGEQSATIGMQLQNIQASIKEIVSVSQESSAAFSCVSARIRETDGLVQSVRSSLETQSEDSRSVIASLEEMDKTAESVRKASSSMAEGSFHVLGKMDNLRTSLNAVRESMSDMLGNAQCVVRDGVKLDGGVESLEENVLRLGKDVSRFKID